MAIHIYGIKNCSTVKKALDWFDEKSLPYVFHDYKKEPATLEKLKQWEEKVSWESLLNKKGTTWRKLSTTQQASVCDAASANAVLLQHNSMIKRPLIEGPKGIVLGFDETEYSSKLL
ncbi:Spx/MgsR family RNA polymerase-binding regulatory protein [Sphingobacterium griseoflavum]|uniref:Arsenate reductase n=1 Tax=Sphingobacterium griseoflavum TaxID=1474952 RepID=A0ABQ3HX98_9SPHI|nr:Spx/MgsR family RNA polymerase-binding regulatory protein [Sphingobacterium griseoflavum]GHE42650.1 arsenate reductase [Sphingobacterium griseoflavum]